VGFTQTAVAGCRVLNGAPSRRAILVDIENILGTADFCHRDAAMARYTIESVFRPRLDDLIIVASSHRGVFAVRRAWPHVRQLWQSGPDGADLQLLGELSHPDIPNRFAEIVLASGDGIFTEAVRQLTQGGGTVTVLAPDGGCSTHLAFAATRTFLFDRSIVIPCPLTSERIAA